MPGSYKVGVWAIEARKLVKGVSYRVAWTVDGRMFRDTFHTRALADGFRSDLVAATRKGEAFDTESGLPVSMARTRSSLSWYELSIKYVDMKWPRAAAKSRAGVADMLATVMPAMLSGDRGRPDVKAMRTALTGWAYNVIRRDTDKPPEVERTLAWLAANTVKVSELEDVAFLRKALDALALKMDGGHAAAKTVTRKRAGFHNTLEYAVELKALSVNRLGEVKWQIPKTVKAIDKRVVVNPRQAVALLDAVAAQKVEGQPRRSSGPMLRAYFASMYYAGLRPAEAAMLGRKELRALPKEGWGELLLSDTAPIAGAAWTDTGERRDRRHLKHRAAHEVRVAQSPPVLTGILNEHVERFGYAGDGRLFRGLDGGQVAESTIARVYDKARKVALTEEEYRSPLAKRPYDLRHAFVSTCLMAGVPPRQIAEWVGHSVWVLLQIYAQVIVGMEDMARSRIDEAYRELVPGSV
ncbi:tyrosine-type recombinase/integrase [Actinokineospora enzanensis]|uniref:tyrosine-type recombinase/integrase n=1 Tax=Actinokineospora enzanensis TaxID=155975 RepID=UPI000367A310|nr:tyrosine-type recombinase/integrase [Actinokineospora enzanensis]